LIREQYPLSLHGVGLSIGAEGPLDLQHLQRLQTLIRALSTASLFRTPGLVEPRPGVPQ
jgi:uncharacterized protein (UPF0276 family)